MGITIVCMYIEHAVSPAALSHTCKVGPFKFVLPFNKKK